MTVVIYIYYQRDVVGIHNFVINTLIDVINLGIFTDANLRSIVVT